MVWAGAVRAPLSAFFSLTAGLHFPGGGCGGVGRRPGPTSTRITHSQNLKSYKKARQQSSGIYLGGGSGWVGGGLGVGVRAPLSAFFSLTAGLPSPRLPRALPLPPPRFAQARLADDGALGLTRALASGQPGNQEATTAAAAHGKTPCSRRKRRGCDAHTRQVDTHYFCHTARTRANRGTHTNTHTGTQAHTKAQTHKHNKHKRANTKTQKRAHTQPHADTQRHTHRHTGTPAHRHGHTHTQPGKRRGAARCRPCSLACLILVIAGGHTASNAPDLFRPPKLSGAGPG